MEKDIVREAKIKAARFCAYRERAPMEVREKLAAYGLEGDQMEEVLNELIEENFLNESRFASAYARGKLRSNKWGKIKIRKGLESYQLNQSAIDQALKELPQDEYLSIMVQLIKKKQRSLKVTNPFVRNHKIAHFVISKGFEPDIVWAELRSKS